MEETTEQTEPAQNQHHQQEEQPPAAAAPAPPAPTLEQIQHPTQALPPPLRAIRRSWQLLSLSYFLNIFAPVLSIHNFTIAKLEADLDGSQPDSYLPTLIQKLLVSLTGDRTTNSSNWESRLRREFLRREPHENPLGEEPAKPKQKIFKRAVGYVYIAEAIPLSTLPTLDDLNSRYAELAQSKNDTSHQDPVNGHSPLDLSHPLHVSGIDQSASVLPDTSSNDTPEPSSKQSPTLEHPLANQVDVKSSELPTPDPHPSDKLATESIESKPLNAASSDISSPAPQNPAGLITITWTSLSPTEKLKAIFKLCEWHFSTSHDLERFRRLVDTKNYNPNAVALDEQFDWRQERCGLDSNGNQYWLSGQGIECRLWIQRREPQPPLKAITLRIPARAKKKGKGAPNKNQKRKYATQESTVTPSTPAAANRGRRCSTGGAPPDSKRAKWTGTRSSTRLRGTPVQPSNIPSSPHPPTRIVIKKPGTSQKSETAASKKQAANGSRRPASRRRTSAAEVWQDVPPGWLDEVVETPSKQASEVLSSDLSEMSDEDDYVGVSRQTKTKPLPTKSKPLPTKSNPLSIKAKPIPVASTSMDESLSELSDSPDVSTIITRDSLSDPPNGADEMEDVRKTNEDESVDHTNGPDEGLGLPTAEDPCPEHKMNDATDDVDQDQKPNIAPLGSLQPSTAGDSLSSLHDTSSQLPTPEANTPINELIPKAEHGAFHSSDAEKVKPCPEGSDAFFPELKGHPLDPDWIEWELVCANLDDWKSFPLQFQDTESPCEQQLVEFVNNEILPEVIAAHNEEQARKEQEEALAQQEEALAQRKRSSRLATREAAQASSMEPEMTAPRETRMHSDRLEAKRLKEAEQEESRKQKDEDQRLVRLREREERIALREAQLASERDAEISRAERARLRAESKLQGKAIKVARPGAENSVPSIESSQQWELNCEICGVTGVNMDDGSEVICCDKCEIWQHSVCHDKADEILKRARRDWATADFICANCSGVAIPRSVKKLRTHVNGKPKPPRPRASKSKDDLNSSAGPSSAIKPKITILMSNPHKLGGTTLNKVSPDLQQSVNSSGETTLPGSNGVQVTQLASNSSVPKKMSLSSSSSSTTVPYTRPIGRPSPTTTTTTTTPPDLSKYYDDLEKLCSILRTNTNLHRNLPIEVMHRLRRYLLDQQAKQREQSATPNTNNGPVNSINNHSTSNPNGTSSPNLHPSLIHSTPPIHHPSIHPNLSHNNNSNSHVLVPSHDPQTIDPQLQQFPQQHQPSSIINNNNLSSDIQVNPNPATHTLDTPANFAHHIHTSNPTSTDPQIDNHSSFSIPTPYSASLPQN
ncbi:hypothetical protein Pst134EB_010026 [Puccinia striiformis f. sp. tritici]|nr:hypothetical protein Pst134EB_010026 [Puccinia striiformis f. sp. tritici]